MEVDGSLFVSRAQGTSPNSYTLATRFSQMLKIAEDRFGPRVSTFNKSGSTLNWTFCGVEFHDPANLPPVIWYPYAGADGMVGHVAIRLARMALSGMREACYELAHECVHFLSPTPEVERVTNLEEGAATVFAIDYVRDYFAHTENASGEYRPAFVLVRQLLAINPDAIKQLRTQGGTPRYFYEITPDEISAVASGLPPEKARLLARPFRDPSGAASV